MPARKRVKTKYPGVYYVVGKSTTGRKTEKIFYIYYRRAGRQIEEKAGRQYKNNMTAAKAAIMRSARLEGKESSNQEKRKEVNKKTWNVDALKDEYFKHRSDNKSAKIDISRYDKYLKSPFGKKEPSDIDQLSVDRLRINLLKSKAPQTVKHVLALLSRIIKFGTDRGLCEGLKFTVRKPPVDNTKTEDLDPEQMQRLIEVLNTTKLSSASNMMKLALFTGMRRGEIFKLKWDDIDFDRGFIFIAAPKGGKSQQIPLNKNARTVFESIKPSSEYVFPNRRGDGPRIDANKDFNEIKNKAGLPKDFRPMHGLRHVYATILATSGAIDMLTLQKLLTHKDQRMTQRYIHFREEALKSAAEQTDKILDSILEVEEEKPSKRTKRPNKKQRSLW